MTIPKGSDSGAQLRLRGKGVQKKGHEGDQYVTLKIVIGEAGDSELAQFLETWAQTHKTEPRRGMGV
jgi:DnaJ-class molecular chaperone